MSYHYRQPSPQAFSLAPFSAQSLKSVLGESLSATLQLTVESSGTYHFHNQMVRIITFVKLHKTWPSAVI